MAAISPFAMEKFVNCVNDTCNVFDISCNSTLTWFIQIMSTQNYVLVRIKHTGKIREYWRCFIKEENTVVILKRHLGHPVNLAVFYLRGLSSENKYYNVNIYLLLNYLTGNDMPIKLAPTGILSVGVENWWDCLYLYLSVRYKIGMGQYDQIECTLLMGSTIPR